MRTIIFDLENNENYIEKEKCVTAVILPQLHTLTFEQGKYVNYFGLLGMSNSKLKNKSISCSKFYLDLEIFMYQNYQFQGKKVLHIIQFKRP